MITFEGKKNQAWITWRSTEKKGKVTIHYKSGNIPSRLTVSSDFIYLKDHRWIQSPSNPSYWELKNPEIEDIMAVLIDIGE